MARAPACPVGKSVTLCKPAPIINYAFLRYIATVYPLSLYPVRYTFK